MARVGRLAGAIVAETGGDHYLIGNPKQPCDWRAAGFEPPGELDARVRPAVRLVRCGAPLLAAPVLELDVEGETLARLLADRFVIARTGSVSERLWRLVTGEGDGELAAQWLIEVPDPIWQIVRDTVLKCS